MAMDLTVHLDMALDRMRQEQLRQGMLLEKLSAQQSWTHEALGALLNSKNGAAYTQTDHSGTKTSSAPLPTLGGLDLLTALKWLGLGLSLLVVAKGGDAKTVLDIVSRFF